MSENRLQWGGFYWVIAKDPLHDDVPVYRARWRGDSFDRRIQQEGRYFLTKEEAVGFVGNLKREYRMQKQREYAVKSYRENGRKRKRVLRINGYRKQINITK